jgi:hypothetical protein
MLRFALATGDAGDHLRHPARATRVAVLPAADPAAVASGHGWVGAGEVSQEKASHFCRDGGLPTLITTIHR